MAFIEPMHRNKPNITYLLTPLEMRRKKLALQDILKLKANPSARIYTKEKQPQNPLEYAAYISKGANIDAGEIVINSIPGILNQLLLILLYPNLTTSSTVCKSRFDELKQKSFFCHMYTDEYKVVTKVAYRLRDGFRIVTAQEEAIDKALMCVKVSSRKML